MARKKRQPYLEIFLALFLFVYCWGTLGSWIYEEGLKMPLTTAIKFFGLRFLIFPLIPIFFARGVYKNNKDFFQSVFTKILTKFPKFIKK